jgi:hypothetical protein
MNVEYMRRCQCLESVTCGILRGKHIQTMPEHELRSYVHDAGIFLHNSYYLLNGENILDEVILDLVNKLDPNSPMDGWGPLASQLIETFGFSKGALT